jgi:hypothetical protein
LNHQPSINQFATSLSISFQNQTLKVLELSTTINMPEIPKEQWAQVIEKTGGPVEYKKIPVQEPGPDEVLVNIKYSGVCHTDLHAVNGDWPLVSSALSISSIT